MILLKVEMVIFFTACYVTGGQGQKWIRRFLGPAFFSICLAWIASVSHKDKLWLATALWYCPSFIIFKYGVNDGSVPKKVLLRGIYGASFGAPGLLLGICSGHPWLGAFQFISAIGNSVYFGVTNPFSRYPQIGNIATILEDICICTGSMAMVPFFF